MDSGVEWSCGSLCCCLLPYPLLWLLAAPEGSMGTESGAGAWNLYRKFRCGGTVEISSGLLKFQDWPGRCGGAPAALGSAFPRWHQQSDSSAESGGAGLQGSAPWGDCHSRRKVGLGNGCLKCGLQCGISHVRAVTVTVLPSPVDTSVGPRHCGQSVRQLH